ncbi:hypothetical protein EYC95_29540 [Pseudomonas sp. BGI-2]|nr:hypothetical protein EYC95_29540 [Pseudomonas sp. BGI-2]
MTAGERSGALEDAFMNMEQNKPGDPDSSFDTDGVFSLSKFPPEFHADRLIKGLALQRDAKIVFAAGLFRDEAFVYALARLNSNGTLDDDFAGQGVTYGNFLKDKPATGGKVVIQPDGKILLLGATLSGTDGWLHLAMARYLETGVIDESFGEKGHLIIENIGDKKFREDSDTLRVLDDGCLLISANFESPDNPDFLRSAVFRFTPDGVPDTRFNGTGRLDFQASTSSPYTRINTCLAQGNKILLAGHALIDGLDKAYIARLEANGSLDKTFNCASQTPGLLILRIDERNTAFDDLARRSDGTLIGIGRVGDAFEKTKQGLLLAITPNGDPHLMFNNGNPLLTKLNNEDGTHWNCGYSQPDGCIVTVSGSYPLHIARFLPNGVIDIGFGSSGFITLDTHTASEPIQLCRHTDNRVLFSNNNVGLGERGIGLIRRYLG